MGNNTVDVTDATFDSDVLQSDKTVLVDFWAEWCAPCKLVAPVLDEIAGQHEADLTVAKVNVDFNPELAARFGILGIPTLLVFKKGEKVGELVGAAGKAKLLSMVEPHLS